MKVFPRFSSRSFIPPTPPNSRCFPANFKRIQCSAICLVLFQVCKATKANYSPISIELFFISIIINFPSASSSYFRIVRGFFFLLLFFFVLSSRFLTAPDLCTRSNRYFPVDIFFSLSAVLFLLMTALCFSIELGRQQPEEEDEEERQPNE